MRPYNLYYRGGSIWITLRHPALFPSVSIPLRSFFPPHLLSPSPFSPLCPPAPSLVFPLPLSYRLCHSPLAFSSSPPRLPSEVDAAALRRLEAPLLVLSMAALSENFRLLLGTP